MNFVSHYNHQNQIDLNYAGTSLAIIGIIFAIILFCSLRKKNNSLQASDEFLCFDTSNTLRGIAILFLIFGHLAIHCIDQEIFFEYAGKWGVIIFLYVSGVALCKRYDINNIKYTFIQNRIIRLFYPYITTMLLFITLDYLLLRKTYSTTRIIQTLLFLHMRGAPNAAAWFVTYIIYLYTLFFLTSKMKLNKLNKILILFISIYLTSICIQEIGFLCPRFSIWVQYTSVFPLSVAIGIYYKKIHSILTRLNKFSEVLFYTMTILLALQYFTGKGNYFVSHLFDVAIYNKWINSLTPITLIISLVMFTFIADSLPWKQNMLIFLGKYSFEIFLIHVPFMVYYDFFLFRTPLYFYFYIYIAVVVLLSVLLKKTSSILNELTLRKLAIKGQKIAKIGLLLQPR